MKTFKEIREGAENYTMKKGPYTRKVDGKTADRMKRQGWKLVAREEVEEARQMKNTKKDSMVQKGGKTIVIDKSKEKEYLRKGWSLAEAFEPHKMYDPKTGKEYDAKTKDDHERMKKLGYSHEKPEVKESVEEAISYGRPKKSTEKDSADADDYKATSDDRKAADKNVIMQIRRGVDMPKGCTVTFQDGKTQKFPQKACQLVAKKFDSFKKPAVRKKFQDEINKSLPSMKKAMNMKG